MNVFWSLIGALRAWWNGRTRLAPVSFPEVRIHLDALTARAWTSTRKASRRDGLLLDPAGLPAGASDRDLSLTLRLLYEHARRVAPGLEVPYGRPRVVVAADEEDVVGTFESDADGFLTLRIGRRFTEHTPAARLILAHEACHHILGLTGLRKDDTRENERLTDATMFVCGFGRIVLDGRAVPSSVFGSYGTRHLGYLGGDECAFAFGHVNASWLRRDPDGDRLTRLRRDLEVAVPDRGAQRRLIARARRRDPAGDEASWIEDVIAEIERDRR